MGGLNGNPPKTKRKDSSPEDEVILPRADTKGLSGVEGRRLAEVEDKTIPTGDPSNVLNMHIADMNAALENVINNVYETTLAHEDYSPEQTAAAFKTISETEPADLDDLIEDLLDENPANDARTLESIFGTDNPAAQFAMQQIAAQMGPNSPFQNAHTAYSGATGGSINGKTKGQIFADQIHHINMNIAQREAALDFLATQYPAIHAGLADCINAGTQEEQAATLKKLENDLTKKLMDKEGLTDEQARPLVKENLLDNLAKMYEKTEGLTPEAAKKMAEGTYDSAMEYYNKNPEAMEAYMAHGALNDRLEEMKQLKADYEAGMKTDQTLFSDANMQGPHATQFYEQELAKLEQEHALLMEKINGFHGGIGKELLTSNAEEFKAELENQLAKYTEEAETAAQAEAAALDAHSKNTDIAIDGLSTTADNSFGEIDDITNHNIHTVDIEGKDYVVYEENGSYFIYKNGNGSSHYVGLGGAFNTSSFGKLEDNFNLDSLSTNDTSSDDINSDTAHLTGVNLGFNLGTLGSNPEDKTLDSIGLNDGTGKIQLTDSDLLKTINDGRFAYNFGNEDLAGAKNVERNVRVGTENKIRSDNAVDALFENLDEAIEQRNIKEKAKENVAATKEKLDTLKGETATARTGKTTETGKPELNRNFTAEQQKADIINKAQAYADQIHHYPSIAQSDFDMKVDGMSPADKETFLAEVKANAPDFKIVEDFVVNPQNKLETVTETAPKSNSAPNESVQLTNAPGIP